MMRYICFIYLFVYMSITILNAATSGTGLPSYLSAVTLRNVVISAALSDLEMLLCIQKDQRVIEHIKQEIQQIVSKIALPYSQNALAERHRFLVDLNNAIIPTTMTPAQQLYRYKICAQSDQRVAVKSVYREKEPCLLFEKRETLDGYTFMDLIGVIHPFSAHYQDLISKGEHPLIKMSKMPEGSYAEWIPTDNIGGYCATLSYEKLKMRTYFNWKKYLLNPIQIVFVKCLYSIFQKEEKSPALGTFGNEIFSSLPSDVKSFLAISCEIFQQDAAS